MASRRIEFDPRSAIVYFDLTFSEDSFEEDLRSGEALKEVSALLGVRIFNEGHSGFGDLVCKFGVDTPQDVFRVAKIVRHQFGGGDDTIYLDAPYSDARGFMLYPKGLRGPQYEFPLVDINPEEFRFVAKTS